MSRTTSYSYDLNGNLVQRVLGNGMAERRCHDARNRVSTLENVTSTGSRVSKYAYQYDAAGNVMEVRERYAEDGLAGRVIKNSYDGVYRLINEQIESEGD